MRGFVANTDFDWYSFLRSMEPPVDEVNLWRPGSEAFKALSSGQPLFFKLKAPHNAICGFGYFAHYSLLPLSVAWSVCGSANGVPSFADMRDRLLRIRARIDMSTDPKQDYWIGCILVNQPLFFGESDWVRVPDDWSETIGQGKTFDLSVGEGQRIWLECLERAAERRHGLEALLSERLPARHASTGDRTMSGDFVIRPRLGPMSFRVGVIDSYGRRCSITSEGTLPVLEAARIRDFQDVQSFTLSNGILFRADIHRLFDAGYVTVTPDHRFEVSRRIKEEFENGRDYDRLHGSLIRLPDNPAHRPDSEALWWHNQQRFLG